jgi:DNA uptake protein ComE-like DNA-binding protein
MRITRALAAAAVALAATTSSLAAQVGKFEGLVDPNRATEQELAALPGFTAELAKAVIAKRPFLTQTAYHAVVSGALSRAQLDSLYRKSFVHVNLNAASDEEILLIPGMGPRMLREFKEYRPYKSLAVWEKEIGKYVKPDELARLEQYVFVPMDPNTATDAELMTIPGMGPRMLREFKEYRPWKSVEQFRKEIGKYVNAAEVARLERYIVINP